MQRKDAGISFFLLALDETTNNTDKVQLSIFIRGVNVDFSLTEKLLGVDAMHGMKTERNIFDAVEKPESKKKMKIILVKIGAFARPPFF